MGGCEPPAFVVLPPSYECTGLFRNARPPAPPPLAGFGVNDPPYEGKLDVTGAD